MAPLVRLSLAGLVTGGAKARAVSRTTTQRIAKPPRRRGARERDFTSDSGMGGGLQGTGVAQGWVGSGQGQRGIRVPGCWDDPQPALRGRSPARTPIVNDAR